MAGFDAFISYSHQADGDFAAALEAGLQRLAKPWNQRRAMEVFLDQQDLNASPHLWSSIVVALDQAEWFVLLASPGSAASKWVGQEISHWLSVPERRERMIVVLTAGTLQWADGDFTDDSDAANPSLRGVFDEEPLYVDMTQIDRSMQLDLHNPLFKERVATLAATIRHSTVGDLVGEDTRQYQRARRLRRIAVVTLAVLTVGAIAASVVALQQRSQAQSQRNEAVRQKTEAENNAAEARARELAATALDTMSEDPTMAALLAVESNYPNLATEPVDIAEAQTSVGVTLRNALGSTARSVGTRLATGSLVGVTDGAIATFEPGAGTIASDGSLGRPQWWDAATGEAVSSPVGQQQDLAMMAPIGKRIPFGDVLVMPEIGAVPVQLPVVLDGIDDVLYGVDVGTGEVLGQSATGDGTVTMRGTVPEGVTLVDLVVGPERDVYGLSASGDVLRWSKELGGAPTDLQVRDVRNLGSSDTTLFLEFGTTFHDSNGRPFPNDSSSAAFRRLQIDGDRLSPVDGLSDGEPTVEGSVRVSPDGRYLAAISLGDGFDQAILVWDLATSRRVVTMPMSLPYQVMWSANDRFVVESARGIDQFQVVPRAVDVQAPVDGVALSSDGSVVATTAARADGTPLVVEGPLADADTTDGPWLRHQFDGVSVDPSGRFVASTQYDDNGLIGVVVRRVGDSAEVARWPDATAAAFSPDGQLLAVANIDGLELVDTTSWASVRRLPLPDDILEMAEVEWASDGTHLLALANGFDTNSVSWIDTTTGQSDFVAQGLAQRVELAPSGSVAAVGLTTGEVQLYSLDQQGDTPLASFVASTTGVSGLTFSPDGRRLVTSGRNNTTVWDVSDPHAVRRVQDVTGLPRWSFRPATSEQLGGVVQDAVGDGEWGSVAFRPDGRSFVMAGPSGMVEVPDFDPWLACSLASVADLEAMDRLLGAPSACERVPALKG